jgi:hypothetical protein
MTRTWFMWWQIRLVWIAFGVFAVSTVRAETLVRDFQGVDSTTSLWRAPAEAKFVRVLRANVETVVPVSDLVPTDRVLSCEDPNVLPGSTTKCGTVQPDTKNNWRLVAVIFPQPPPPVQKFTNIAVTWTYKPDENTAPLSELIGYRLQLKLQPCNPANAGCPVEGYGTPIELGVVNSYSTAVPGEMYQVCASVLARTAETDGTYAEKCSSRQSAPGTVEIAVEFASQ